MREKTYEIRNTRVSQKFCNILEVFVNLDNE